jgi:uncharacterized membrane protein
MSFELGKKLGLTASLIAVIVPVITVILYGLLFLSLFGIISSALTGGSQTFVGSLFPAGIAIAFVAIGIIGLIGIILFLVAMHSLSQYYSETGIFRNALYGFLINIIGVAALIVIAFALVFTTIVSSATSSTPGLSGAAFITVFLVVIVAALAISIVSAVFYMRAFNKLGEKSGVHTFNTAGLLYLIGTVLTIVLVGSLLVWIAWIFALSGFNSLKPKTAETSTVSYSTPQPSMAYSVVQKRYCPYCGAQLSPDSVYCANCGKQLQ